MGWVQAVRFPTVSQCCNKDLVQRCDVIGGCTVKQCLALLPCSEKASVWIPPWAFWMKFAYFPSPEVFSKPPTSSRSPKNLTVRLTDLPKSHSGMIGVHGCSSCLSACCRMMNRRPVQDSPCVSPNDRWGETSEHWMSDLIVFIQNRNVIVLLFIIFTCKNISNNT